MPHHKYFYTRSLFLFEQAHIPTQDGVDKQVLFYVTAWLKEKSMHKPLLKLFF